MFIFDFTKNVEIKIMIYIILSDNLGLVPLKRPA